MPRKQEIRTSLLLLHSIASFNKALLGPSAEGLSAQLIPTSTDDGNASRAEETKR